MPTNEQLIELLTRVSLLETHVAALDSRVRDAEMAGAGHSTGIQMLQGAIATTVNDLIVSRDKVTDRLFSAVDIAPKATVTKPLGVTATDTAMK
jgi:hypothetical protein